MIVGLRQSQCLGNGSTVQFRPYFPTAPSAPQFLPDECSAENNTVTIAWQPHVASVQDGYTLELDDGHDGDFRVSTAAQEFSLQVEGAVFKAPLSCFVFVLFLTFLDAVFFSRKEREKRSFKQQSNFISREQEAPQIDFSET